MLKRLQELTTAVHFITDTIIIINLPGVIHVTCYYFMTSLKYSSQFLFLLGIHVLQSVLVYSFLSFFFHVASFHSTLVTLI
jgi:hypothetical protein